jgi:hypothetical protein
MKKIFRSHENRGNEEKTYKEVAYPILSIYSSLKLT